VKSLNLHSVWPLNLTQNLSSDGDAKSGNCPPGFVADHGINSPIAVDFYIQSHGGLLGSELYVFLFILRILKP
jgi:hypothetical protein